MRLAQLDSYSKENGVLDASRTCKRQIPIIWAWICVCITRWGTAILQNVLNASRNCIFVKIHFSRTQLSERTVPARIGISAWCTPQCYSTGVKDSFCADVVIPYLCLGGNRWEGFIRLGICDTSMRNRICQFHDLRNLCLHNAVGHSCQFSNS